MAGLNDISKEKISILDPGAGIGILSVALIQELANKKGIKKINEALDILKQINVPKKQQNERSALALYL